MKRIALLVTALTLLVGASPPAFADDPGTITSHVSEYAVSAVGDLSVVETITVDFPEPRHGIFRTFGSEDIEPKPALPVRASITMTRDGSEEPVSIADRAGGLTVRIGDPEQTITGSHVYVIRYRVKHAVAEGDDEGEKFSEFFWETIGEQWELPILSSKLTVHLPGQATDGSCGAGFGETDGCEGVGTSEISFSTGRLEPGTPVTVRADYVVDPAMPPPSLDADTAVAEVAGVEKDESSLNVSLVEALIAIVPVGVLLSGGVAFFLIRRRTRGSV